MRHFFLLSLVIAIMLSMSGCAIGMLFYRDTRTKDIYRSPGSKKNYYTIKATTLSHCGCTYLMINNYVNKKKTFYIRYNYSNVTEKTIYSINDKTKKVDTVELEATTNNDFSIPLDSLDLEIYNRIDNILLEKPKEIIYEIKRKDYKGYKRKPKYLTE